MRPQRHPQAAGTGLGVPEGPPAPGDGHQGSVAAVEWDGSKPDIPNPGIFFPLEAPFVELLFLPSLSLELALLHGPGVSLKSLRVPGLLRGKVEMKPLGQSPRVWGCARFGSSSPAPLPGGRAGMEPQTLTCLERLKPGRKSSLNLGQNPP